MDYTRELTHNFYAWQERGRGRTLHPSPVFLEPPFRFFGRPSVEGLAGLDDARRRSLLSWIVDHAFRRKKTPSPSEVGEELPALHEPEELAELELHLPRDLRVTREVSEGFLQSLLVLKHPLAFEVTASSGVIRYGATLDPLDRPALTAGVHAFLPGVSLGERLPLKEVWASTPGESVVEEFSLAREFMVPLGTAFAPDPLLPLLGLLSQVGTGELAVLQVLFLPARKPWRDAILRAVRTPAGGPFFADAPEVTKQAEEKVSFPLFAVALRLALKASSRARLFELARLLSGSLSALGRDNRLLPLTDNGEGETDFLGRRSRRTGMLLSLRELALLVHLPDAGLSLPAIARGTRKEKEPPKEAREGGVPLGESLFRGKGIPVFLTEAARLRHAHLIGATGTGKTTLLLNLILEDLKAGRGVGVVDPHGDLTRDILARMPEERLGDLVLLDPSDQEVSSGWNALAVRDDAEREVLSSDLVSLFRRYATSWGDQMSTTLSNALAALLADRTIHTLSDLRRFLVDRPWRESLIAGLPDPEIRFFWDKEFPHIGERSLGPILGRLNTFLRSRPIRDSISEPQGIDFRKLLDLRGIFIARLPLGTLGEENVAVVGSLLVSKLHQVALSRADRRPEEREPFFLYLDEFHLFAGPSLSTLLSGARKFGLSLTMAHQSLAALHGRFPEIEASLMANAFTRLIFRVGEEDARRLEKGLGTFDAEDLLSLRTGEAVCRLGEKDKDFLFRVPEPVKLSGEEEAERQSKVRRVLAERLRRTPPEPTPVPVMRPVAVPEKKSPPRPEPIREEGKGGQEHRYVQELVKRWAESLGLRAALEEPTPDGGSVDVAVRGKSWSLACEISVSSTPEYEAKNVRKGLLAGFDEVAVVSQKDGALAKIHRKLEESLSEEERGRIHLFSPEELLAYLESKRESEKTVGRFNSPEAKRPGKGGAEHTYLQELVKRWAEERGFRAVVEEQIAGSRESIDVALYRGDARIACEVTVTTPLDYEVGNARKCLAAGFGTVAVVSLKKARLAKLDRLLADSLPSEDYKRVKLFTPEELLDFLAGQPAREEEGVVHGYKVKVRYQAPESARSNRVAEILAKSMRRLRKEEG